MPDTVGDILPTVVTSEKFINPAAKNFIRKHDNKRTLIAPTAFASGSTKLEQPADQQTQSLIENAEKNESFRARPSNGTAGVESGVEVAGSSLRDSSGDEPSEETNGEEEGVGPSMETFHQSIKRHFQNIVHFFVEDWFLSAMLGFITAVLSITVDVSYEYLNHYRVVLFDLARQYDRMIGFTSWVAYLVILVTAAALVCRYVAVQAIGSGIPEVKVIMNGFMLQNYLSFRTLVSKVISLILTLGSGLPVGKEGPFVHMGAIVGTLLSKMTKAWQSNAFFSNEGRELEILSSGCSVGIACTFSSPAGAVLYGIESTSKYFAVKNYWRSFFATTCSALIFRFANAVVIPPHIAGTITAYYQTSFPNEVFLVEEIPMFIIVGLLSGLLGALFVLLHRRITYFRKRNRTYRAVFGRNSLAFTIFMAFVVGVITYPDGFGRYIAGKFTFRETLSDFINNCTMSLHNITSMGCDDDIVSRWSNDYGSLDKGHAMPNVFPTLLGYLVVNYVMVAICITLAIPAGIFVPSFVIGACGGRIIGEMMVVLFPQGIRGPDGPQIYPGLYAVVGAAAYTGAVTHSLSIAVIVCETTGQLSPLLPVLIALMVANAVSSFLQPSIYESIIDIKRYPHLAELPPSRISVHTLKVEQIMVRDVVYITRKTTYKELRELLIATPYLRSYPLVTDDDEHILLGSVARKYLHFLLTLHLGPDPILQMNGRRLRNATASEIFGSYRGNSHLNLNSLLRDRNVCGNTLLSISPLHDDHHSRQNPIAPVLLRQAQNSEMSAHSSSSMMNRAMQLRRHIDLDDVAVDAAPFQLVKGTSLYKVHTLFSLLGLNHAYVTHRGHLIGVVSLRELRLALAKIYTRGAVPPLKSHSIPPTLAHSHYRSPETHQFDDFYSSSDNGNNNINNNNNNNNNGCVVECGISPSALQKALESVEKGNGPVIETLEELAEEDEELAKLIHSSRKSSKAVGKNSRKTSRNVSSFCGENSTSRRRSEANEARLPGLDVGEVVSVPAEENPFTAADGSDLRRLSASNSARSFDEFACEHEFNIQRKHSDR